MRLKRLAITALVALGALTLAACGSNNDDSTGGMSGMDSSTAASPSPSSHATGDFNDADVTFATNMIPHHQQAVEMAELAETRATDPAVKELAAQIKGAQDPEIQKMSSWLTSWGKPVPAEMSGMDMSGQMPGMMSMDEMNKLTAMSGAGFDQMFLTMMIRHHEGAIKMARTEQDSGANADAIALAGQIATAQTEEIKTMHKLLK